MIFLIIISLLLAFIAFNLIKRPKTKSGYKNIPLVAGGLPFVGHGLDFSKDVVGFVKKCYDKYGKIFCLKVFNKNIVVICDHELKKEFFKNSEEAMSLYKLLTNIYFADAFSDDPKKLPSIIKLVKSTVAVRFDTFAPKIVDEAQKMIDRLKKQVGNKISIGAEMIKFVANTSARCFIGLSISDEFYNELIKFTNLLNKIVVMTYFLPKWLLRYSIGIILAKHRKRMTLMLNDEIETYRTNINKNDSLIIRKSVDYTDSETGYQLSNGDIGDIIVCLLYVSSENTALGLLSAMIDLAQNDKYWEKVKLESTKYLEKNDIKGLFTSELIDSCVMESARLGTHIFPIGRKPCAKDTLGEYFLDNNNIDNIALCLPLMMTDNDIAKEVFDEPEIYNPSRYDNNKSAKNANSIMTWGSGSHLCPGKLFAIYEIKMAMALLTITFKQFNVPKTIKKDYFSPSAFAEKKAIIELELLESPYTLGKIYISEDKQIVEYPNGWLIKGYLSNSEQLDYYVNISNMVECNEKVKQDKVMPVVQYNMVYTQSSNCARPDQFINLGKDIVDYLNKKSQTFPKHLNKNYNFDSVYMQVYGQDASMKTHYDEYVTWGISLSIGKSCEMIFGNETIYLESGDVLVADFSKVLHGIKKVHTDGPQWFENEYEYDNNKFINTFGGARASIQIRNVSDCKIEKVMTNTEFRNMFN